MNARLSAPTSLRDMLAQLIFPRIGSNLPPIRTVAEDADRVADMLRQVPLGGLCLFNGSWPETPRALSRLQDVSSTPLLVAADVERGVGQQVRGLTVFPHAMAFAATGENAESLVERWGKITGEQSLESGIDIVLGPVADVNTDRRNPIIASRSFGDRSDHVACLVSAYIRGCQSAGALCSVKHFPGHGNTHEDSHERLPTINAPRDHLFACDLVPFQAAIDVGVDAVMTAHIAYPALDASGVPATVSQPILSDLLRQQMGFRSVVMSDSMLMSGVREQFPDEASMAMAALRAGVDMLLDIKEPLRVIDELLKFVEQDKLDVRLVERAFERVWKLKSKRAASGRGKGVERSGSHHTKCVSEMAEASEFAMHVARQAIVAHGSADREACIPPGCHLGVLVVKPFDASWDPTEQPLGAFVRELHKGPVSTWQLSPDSESPEQIAQAAAQCDELLIAVIVTPADWHRFDLLPWQYQIVHELCGSTSVTLVSLGVPWVLDDFGGAASRWCTFSDVDVSQKAIAEFLIGC